MCVEASFGQLSLIKDCVFFLKKPVWTTNFGATPMKFTGVEMNYLDLEFVPQRRADFGCRLEC